MSILPDVTHHLSEQEAEEAFGRFPSSQPSPASTVPLPQDSDRHTALQPSPDSWLPCLIAAKQRMKLPERPRRCERD